ncbi:MAG: sulfatase [Planctomycetota bacterium]|nr:sulfatase [Planctomycetota bacterium]
MSRIRTSRAALPLIFALIACAKAADVPPDYGDRRPIVLISIDSLRADHCTPYGHRSETAPGEESTPFLARMAREGALFENASAASPWTLPSHVTLLSGMHPREHGVRTRKFRIPDELELVSGRLRQAGYQTAGFFSGPFLHNVWGFGHGFDLYQPGVTYLADPETGAHLAEAGKSDEVEGIHAQSHSDAECAEQVVGKAIEWLERKDRYREPFFLFLHLWDPHYDYFPPAEYRDRFLPDGATARGDEFLNDEIPLTPELKRELLGLYDAEIRYTDDWIARLDAQFEAWGIADDVILLITADHGEEFLEHGNRGHHLTLYEEVMHVPMLVRAPGLVPAGVRVAGSVSIADVAPTLLDFGGAPAWPDRSGVSLRRLIAGGDGNHTVRMDLLRPTKQLQLIGWREGSEKLIYDSQQRLTSIFDLTSDRFERAPRSFDGLDEQDAFLQRAVASLRLEPQTPVHPPGEVSEPEHVSTALNQAGYVDDK